MASLIEDLIGILEKEDNEYNQLLSLSLDKTSVIPIIGFGMLKPKRLIVKVMIYVRKGIECSVLEKIFL